MIDSFCSFLLKRIRISIPDINDEKADQIYYGLQLIIGEIPKIILLFIIGAILGIFELTLISFIAITIFRTFSGGFHMKTHLGCIIISTLMFCGNVYLSKYLVVEDIYIRYGLYIAIWIFGMIMTTLYAPADTENVPILGEKQKKRQKIESYLSLTFVFLIAFVIKDITISNIFAYGALIQSISISKPAYRLFRNKYGYEVYTSTGELIN